MILRHGNELLVRMDGLANESEADAVDRAIKAVATIASEDERGIAAFVCGLIACIFSVFFAVGISSTGHMGPAAAMIFVGLCTLMAAGIAYFYYRFKDMANKSDAVFKLIESQKCSTLATKYVREWARANPSWTKRWANACEEYHGETTPDFASPT